MKKKFLVIIDGTIGSGKTTVAEILHDKIKGTALVSLDNVRQSGWI